jgi:hypothetical protein
MLVFFTTTAGAGIVPADFMSITGLRLDGFIIAMPGYNLGHR